MYRRPPYHPRAFTLVELLIVISIIGMLMSLLLPAVNAVRGRARQAECANNLKQLATAVQNHVSSKETYPGYTQIVNDQTPSGNQVEFASWAAVLLPLLEQQDIWDTIRRPGAVNAATFPNVTDGLVPRINIFECPADVGTNSNMGWLSYVANAGAFDENDSPGPSDYDENGVFHNLAWAAVGQPNMNGPQLRVSAIKDGMSKTLLLSENLDKLSNGDREPSPTRNGWLSGLEQHLGMVWVYDSGSSGPSFTPNPNYQEGINRDLTQNRDNSVYVAIPKYARPSSNHAGGVNAAFCGGMVDFLSEDIDYSVYQRLMTPYGKKCRDPQAPSTILPDIFYNLPPLTDSDFKK